MKIYFEIVYPNNRNFSNALIFRKRSNSGSTLNLKKIKKSKKLFLGV